LDEAEEGFGSGGDVKPANFGFLVVAEAEIPPDFFIPVGMEEGSPGSRSDSDDHPGAGISVK
jgi:hypothetical protein